MSTPDFNQLLSFFKVLSHQSRLKLVGVLAQRECSVEELAALLKLKEPTVSHHLAKLKELDLVQMRPEGNIHFYQLNLDALQQLTKAIFSANQITALAEDIEADAWETTILRNFLEGDPNGICGAARLKEIPASRKKRWVILKWLVGQFDADTAYPEAQVNEIIQRHHPDSATLRRELIGYQFMQRDQGIYRRLPEAVWKAAV